MDMKRIDVRWNQEEVGIIKSLQLHNGAAGFFAVLYSCTYDAKMKAGVERVEVGGVTCPY